MRPDIHKAAQRVRAPAAVALLLLAAWAPPSGARLPSGIDVAAIDRSVRPGDDFDAYASGAWRARVEIPADKSETGTIDSAVDTTQDRIRSLIEDSAKGHAAGRAQLIGDLYAAFMDEARVEQVDDAPLKADLAAVRAVADKAAMARFMGETQGRFGRGYFSLNVWIDAKDTTRHVLRIEQDGLGLGRREGYLNEGTADQVAAYRAYVARTLDMIGWPDAERAAGDILAMERRVAEASWSMVENSDRAKRYNPATVAALEVEAPGFPWRAYLAGAGAPDQENVIALQRSAFPRIAAVYASTPLETLKAWEAFQVVDQASPYLSKRFVDNHFAFHGKIEWGVPENQPRWRRAVNAVDASLSDALGHEYVARYFPPESKARVEAMAANFRAAMSARIERVSWMAPATKVAAQKKLARLRIMVGYPDRWRDYAGLKIGRADLYGDMVRAKAFNWAYDVGKLSRPVDPGEWFLPPQIVDAFSDQSRVAMGIPAGILQPPLFDPGVDEAANYGAVGEALGHELTHQFDDQGRKADATGALNDWWAPEDAASFEQAAARLAKQFDAYEAVPGVHVNGRQTLSENIADLGGLLLALDAYHLSLKGRPAPVIDGLTGDQRVFLAWARVFRVKDRDESRRLQAQQGGHTPFRFRALAPMRNIDAWYAAFNVKPGDKNYLKPEDRVRIW